MPRMTHFAQKEAMNLIRTAKRALRHAGLDILLAPRATTHGRILVVTSRKIGIAAKRNKVRRRLKAIFYEERLFEAPFDCIIFVKPVGTTMPYEQLKKLLTETIKRFEIEHTDEKTAAEHSNAQGTAD